MLRILKRYQNCCNAHFTEIDFNMKNIVFFNISVCPFVLKANQNATLHFALAKTTFCVAFSP